MVAVYEEADEQTKEELESEAREYEDQHVIPARELLDDVIAELAPIIDRRADRDAGDIEAQEAVTAVADEGTAKDDWEDKKEDYDGYKATYDSTYANSNQTTKDSMDEQLTEYQREMDKYEREYEAAQAVRMRAETAQARREEANYLDEQIAFNDEVRNYYTDVIGYNDQKLDFFDLVYLTFEDTPYGWSQKDMVDEQINVIYDQNYLFQTQLEDIDTHISNLEFQKYIQEQRWDQELFEEYEEDAIRMQAQRDSYEAELEDIETAIGASYLLTGAALTDWIDDYGSVAYDEWNNRKTDVDEWLQ